MTKTNKVLRRFVDAHNKKRLKNKEFSLISSNCNGALILHDLGLGFRTPTVDLLMKPKDYIKFLGDLRRYIYSEIEFFPEDEKAAGYPVGTLEDGIKVHFMHYKTKEDALEKWQIRAKRVDFGNLFIMFSDRGDFSYQYLKDFDVLPYENKVVFTNRQYPEIKSAFYIKGFEDRESVGALYEFIGPFSGKKYYDQFPYVKWFNGELKQ